MTHALTLETYQLTKRFGAFTALDGVSLTVRPDDGAVMVDQREHDIHSPTVARDLGIGMVYQHFTVVPGMTVAENLRLARGHIRR